MARLDQLIRYSTCAVLLAITAQPVLGASSDSTALEAVRTQLRLKQFAQAFDLLTPLAKAGNANAELLLANLYQNGLVTNVTAEQSNALAQDWFSKAAAHGNADAMYQMAVLEAQHDAPNHELIAQWLQRAAKADHPLAKEAVAAHLVPQQFQPEKAFADISTRHAAFWLAATHNNIAQLQAFNETAQSNSLINATDEFGRTALILAARTGASAATQWLLQNGADVQHADSAGMTALMLAANQGHGSIVKQLLGAKADSKAQDRNGNNALMYAISSNADAAAGNAASTTTNRADIINDLLAVTDLAQRNTQGWSALDWAINHNDTTLITRLRTLGLSSNKKAVVQSSKPAVPFQHAATADLYRGWPDILLAGTRNGTERVEAVLQNNAAALRGNESALLLTAVQAGNTPLIDNLLARGVTADLNQNDTPVSWAVRHGQTALVQQLLSKGSKPDAHGKREVAPLLDAIHHDATIDIVNALLKAGASTEVRDADGRTPLMLAAVAKRSDLLERLIQSGANLDATDRAGWNALMLAANHNSDECVRALLNARANPDKRDNEGNSALMLAAARGNATSVDLLLAAGANPGTNRHGDSALIMAATQGNDATIKRLLTAGFKVNAINKHGDTALIAAARAGQASVVRILLAAGADTDLRNNDRASAKDVADRLAMKDISALLREHG